MPHARILADAYRRAGDDRVLELGIGTNAALTLRRFGAWGYDPVVLDRYARLMARTQGWSERMLERILSQPVARDHPALRMLRVRYEVAPSGEVTAFSGALPRLLLVEDHLRVDGAEAALDTVMASGFDPRRTVVLESDPVPPPRAASVPGTLRLVSESTDALEIEAELQAPALLLISDAYARGWRARALPGSQQTEYTLLPADYVLRAVPLSAGRHRLVVEYAPAAFRAGAWASSIATWLFVAAALWWGVRTRQRRRALAPAPEPAGPGPRLGG
jgi:hypothetical protein